ncbi:MAG: DUF4838 domain-containing protein [Lentisphaeria bacterium]|nr:DUF4838 domain-containing protein [Lentisphaeria bacterium]
MRIVLSVLLFAVGSLLFAADLVLAEKGKTTYSIVVDKNAGAVDQFAARELSYFLNRITGAEFKIVHSSGSPAIYVGHAKGKALPDQVNVIETQGKDLFLYGGGVHGTLWAVYELIENKFGCMFLNAYGDLHIPQRQKLVLGKTFQRKEYAFPARALMNWFYRDKAAVSLAYYRNRQNLLLHSINHPRYPGKEPGIICREEYFIGEHSLSQLIPPGVKSLKLGYEHGFLKPLPGLEAKRYFLTNPEFFSMDENGKRVPNRQLCFSNPELRKELEKNVVAFYNAMKKKTGLNAVVQISCNDIAYNMCFCKNCQDLQKQYKAEGAPLFLAVAEIARKNPHISFRTTAYQRGQTQRAPKGIQFPDNISLVFAPINGDFANPLNRGRINQRDLQDFTDWTKITRKILFWHYPNPYNRERDLYFIEPPTSILDRVAEDLKIMKNAGLQGGPYFEHDSAGAHYHANFFELQSWVMLKLFQDPEQNVQKLVRQFIPVFYGPAASEVQLFYDQLTAGMREFTQNGGSWNYRTMDNPYLTKVNLLRWDSLMDQAAEKVSGVYAERIARLRLGIDSTLVSKFNDKAVARMDRIRTTLTALEKKGLITVGWKSYNTWRKTMDNRVAESPLPPSVAAVKEVVVMNVPAKGKTVVQRKDANLGVAFAEKRVAGKPFRIGLYDKISKATPAVRVFNPREIRSQNFELYQINKKPLSLTRNTILFGGSWWLSFPVGTRVVSADDVNSLNRKWYIFISLKETADGIFSDRLVLIPAEKCPAEILQKAL